MPFQLSYTVIRASTGLLHARTASDVSFSSLSICYDSIFLRTNTRRTKGNTKGNDISVAELSTCDKLSNNRK